MRDATILAAIREYEDERKAERYELRRAQRRHFWVLAFLLSLPPVILTLNATGVI